MTKGRLEAFSDGVIAIIITIMVLELEPPHGKDWAAFRPVVAGLLTYVLSFVYLGIYWNNHHHMLHATQRVNGRVLWANLHLLFWLSLIPFTTAWIGETVLAPLPTAVYGAVLLLSGFAYSLLLRELLACQGEGSELVAAVGSDRKGRLSLFLYAVAIALAPVHTALSAALYVLVAVIWFVPDSRIEARLSR